MLMDVTPQCFTRCSSPGDEAAHWWASCLPTSGWVEGGALHGAEANGGDLAPGVPGQKTNLSKQDRIPK